MCGATHQMFKLFAFVFDTHILLLINYLILSLFYCKVIQVSAYQKLS